MPTMHAAYCSVRTIDGNNASIGMGKKNCFDNNKNIAPESTKFATRELSAASSSLFFCELPTGFVSQGKHSALTLKTHAKTANNKKNAHITTNNSGFRGTQDFIWYHWKNELPYSNNQT